MNLSRMTLLLGIASLVCLGFTAPAWATDSAGSGADAACSAPIAKLITGHIGRLLVLKSELNVSADQKRKIADTVKSRKEEIKPAVRQLLEKRWALRDAVFAQPSDDHAIRKAAADLAGAIGDVAVVAAKVVSQARNVFTPQQQDQIKKFGDSCRSAEQDWVKQIGN